MIIQHNVLGWSDEKACIVLLSISTNTTTQQIECVHNVGEVLKRGPFYTVFRGRDAKGESLTYEGLMTLDMYFNDDSDDYYDN